jgi:hypothetical protein
MATGPIGFATLAAASPCPRTSIGSSRRWSALPTRSMNAPSMPSNGTWRLVSAISAFAAPIGSRQVAAHRRRVWAALTAPLFRGFFIADDSVPVIRTCRACGFTGAQNLFAKSKYKGETRHINRCRACERARSRNNYWADVEKNRLEEKPKARAPSTGEPFRSTKTTIPIVVVLTMPPAMLKKPDGYLTPVFARSAVALRRRTYIGITIVGMTSQRACGDPLLRFVSPQSSLSRPVAAEKICR